MVLSWRKTSAVIALLSLGTAAMLAQGNPFDTHKAFSATMVVEAGAKGSAQMKMYRSGSKMRVDMPAGTGANGYIVTDLDAHISYMVMGPAMCMKMPVQPHRNPFAAASNAKIERTPAGTDTVDGHPCKVENVTVTGQDEKPVKMKVWEADDLQGFPVKIQVENPQRGNGTVLYKDISFETPSASQFTHPDDCREMPTGMGGMMPQ